jgi:hypothetical protein
MNAIVVKGSVGMEYASAAGLLRNLGEKKGYHIA